jgi:hypothetical protein
MHVQAFMNHEKLSIIRKPLQLEKRIAMHLQDINEI